MYCDWDLELQRFNLQVDSILSSLPIFRSFLPKLQLSGVLNFCNFRCLFWIAMYSRNNRIIVRFWTQNWASWVTNNFLSERLPVIFRWHKRLQVSKADFSPMRVIMVHSVFCDINNFSNPVANLMWSRDHPMSIFIGYSEARQTGKAWLFVRVLCFVLLCTCFVLLYVQMATKALKFRIYSDTSAIVFQKLT